MQCYDFGIYVSRFIFIRNIIKFNIISFNSDVNGFTVELNIHNFITVDDIDSIFDEDNESTFDENIDS